jgi:hypothetical protein
MPVPATLLYVAPLEGDRVFVEASCTVERKCK